MSAFTSIKNLTYFCIELLYLPPDNYGISQEVCDLYCESKSIEDEAALKLPLIS